MMVLFLAGALVLAQADAAFAKFEEDVNRTPALQLTFSQSGVLKTGGEVSIKLEVKGTLALATGNRMHMKVVQTTDWCEKDRKESVSEFTFISDGKLFREILRRDGQDTVTDRKTPELL